MRSTRWPIDAISLRHNRFWSHDYIQHSAHIPPGRDGLFNLVKPSPPDRRYENALTVADGDYVMLHGRLSTTGPHAA
jgi:predicted SnoaL-like aldol condensation-catalyzing enzyme